MLGLSNGLVKERDGATADQFPLPDYHRGKTRMMPAEPEGRVEPAAGGGIHRLLIEVGPDLALFGDTQHTAEGAERLPERLLQFYEGEVQSGQPSH